VGDIGRLTGTVLNWPGAPCCILEGFEQAFKIVPDHQNLLLLEQLAGALKLLGLAQGLKAVAFQVGTQHLGDALSRDRLFEAQEAGPIREQSGAGEPIARLAGQGRLAHAAHGVQQNGPVGAKGTFQGLRLTGAALEGVQRRTREGAKQVVERLLKSIRTRPDDDSVLKTLQKMLSS
jgi:hypothetical protein